MREAAIEQALGRKIKQAGGLFIKLGVDGWPDRIVILPGGKILWVELKADKGKKARLQEYRSNQLSDLGCNVFTIKGIEEANKFVTEVI